MPRPHPLALLALVPMLAMAAPPADTLHLPQGELAGRTKDGVIRCPGIPYAGAPLGAQRWREPSPAPRWSGVLHAGRPAWPRLRPPTPQRLKIGTHSQARPILPPEKLSLVARYAGQGGQLGLVPQD